MPAVSEEGDEAFTGTIFDNVICIDGPLGRATPEISNLSDFIRHSIQHSDSIVIFALFPPAFDYFRFAPVLYLDHHCIPCVLSRLLLILASQTASLSICLSPLLFDCFLVTTEFHSLVSP